jgi:signal transduction histidine kinase
LDLNLIKTLEPEFQPHVFERFRPGDMPSSRRAGGLGLGLSLVKHLVELRGGNVEVASAGADQAQSSRFGSRCVPFTQGRR